MLQPGSDEEKEYVSSLLLKYGKSSKKSKELQVANR
jgi:hypothetical protein